MENRIILKIKSGYYLEFYHLKRWNYLEALKLDENENMVKMVNMIKMVKIHVI